MVISPKAKGHTEHEKDVKSEMYCVVVFFSEPYCKRLFKIDSADKVAVVRKLNSLRLTDPCLMMAL